MTRVKIRHYVVKGRKAFWQPTKKMKAAGFGPVPCGPDGPDAWARAEEWNRRWDQTRTGAAPSPATVIGARRPIRLTLGVNVQHDP